MAPNNVGASMDLEFSGEIFYWRGPAPFFFVNIPEDQSSDIKAISKTATYGWGVIPVTVQIGNTEWTTSLFPKAISIWCRSKRIFAKPKASKKATT